jgi:hypothetical protein
MNDKSFHRNFKIYEINSDISQKMIDLLKTNKYSNDFKRKIN